MIHKPLHFFLAGITTLVSTFQIASPIIFAFEPVSNDRTTMAVSQRSRKASYSVGGISPYMKEKEIRAKWGKPIRREQGQAQCTDYSANINYSGVEIRSVERLWELVSAYLRREEPPNSARLEYPQTHNLPAEAGFSDSTLLD